MKTKIFYRVAHKDTNQGLWYDNKGEFTGLIHNELSFCKNKDLQMPFDESIVGWLSATDSLKDLWNWFTEEDVEQLEQHGFFITTYLATNYRYHNNHWVIDQHSSLKQEVIALSSFLISITK